MSELLQKRLANLISVKSLVTIILTLTFAALTLTGAIGGQDFLTVFTVVIAFYFGTQSQKAAEDGAGGKLPPEKELPTTGAETLGGDSYVQ